MESLRVLIDTGDPCPDCGAPATVYERADDPLVGWFEEFRECSLGCTEVAAALALAPPARVRRRAVA